MNFGSLIALNKLKEDHESQEAIKPSTEHDNDEEEGFVINDKKKNSPKLKKEDFVYTRDIE